jgi:pilus assembly protein CpaE
MARKILIVDDDLESVKLIGVMLERHGYLIAAAQTGAQALARVQSENPDLVILDIMVPDMDGYEVCRQIRADPATADLPIIMFTAKTQLDDKVAGFKAGADDYLVKPVHPNELVSRVEAVLLRSSRQTSEIAETVSVIKAKTFGFLGAKGGVGNTTLAVNVAVALAKTEGKKIYFADMRPSMATSSFEFGLRRAGTIANLLEMPAEQIDTQTVEAQLEEHRSGVFVLSGQSEPLGVANPMSAAHAVTIVQHLSAMADYLCLDLGVGLGEVNRRLLQDCYQIVVTIEPQRASILLAKLLLTELVESLHIPRHRIGLVMINKAASAATLNKGKVEEMIQHDLAGVVPPAPELAFQAFERGVPMILVQPNSLVTQQIQAVADYLCKG